MKRAFAVCFFTCVTLWLTACTTTTSALPQQSEPSASTPTTPPAASTTSSPDGAVGGSGPTRVDATGAAGAGAMGTAGAGRGGVATGGGQQKMCGGIAGLRCPAKQYCSFAPEARCGAGDMSGTCAPTPEVCTQQLDEVCGCDDKTYGNACTAAQAGVSVAMKGACKPRGASPATATGAAEGSLCGTRGAPQECGPGLYCAFKTQCGATDAGGTCSKRPSICTKIYAPVCGCDGKTYASGCTAAAAGVSVAKTGACQSAK